jgi:hypothetical protein
MSAGDSGVNEGRLSIVNPVTRLEIANFGGFGLAPGGMDASADLLLVSSWTEGVMTFDTRTRELLRGAGEGVDVPLNSSVAVGAKGRIYAFDAGPCTAGMGGEFRVLRSTDLAEVDQRGFAYECPVGALITTVPVAP